MRRWTRPSRPRRAAGKERVAGGEAAGGFGATGGKARSRPWTAKQTVPARLQKRRHCNVFSDSLWAASAWSGRLPVIM